MLSIDNSKNLVVYVDDDEDDLQFVRSSFALYENSLEVLTFQQPHKAYDFFLQLEAVTIKPCLIILDMNMPGMDGRETLIRIRQSEEYKNIPVVVFTTSSHKSDKDFAQRWGADFITKPLVYTELEELAKAFVSKCNFEISKRA